MESFEKQYYESASFWEGEMLQDDNNKLRIKLTADLIPKGVKSLVDVGCGNGMFLNYLQKIRADLELLVIDRSETALSFVNTQKKVGDIISLPFEDNSFDCVTCLEVIEHLPHNIYEIALKELTRISKKYVIISVPFNEKIEDSYNKCPKCLSIFNYELHLRKYVKNDMAFLLNKLNPKKFLPKPLKFF
jgi:ubiquinone/menaquinone biosynthesis C-methylase UbiE